ncbi:metallophosphoesterase family protein [Xylanivirga thermophila]|jgi:exonuclease SbcD|uniref:metallophosphoesterase family protein n=1 Tax=Xylanivirga thermophila TaxID=2496273 RepID=UPI00101CCCC9|nr:exonuclease SbcCD subunit D [Xylanivirga thermophila]
MSDVIKIIHTADLHIGVQNYGRLDSKIGMHTRIADFLKSLDKVVDYAIETGQHAFLISGDIFKNREPDVTQQREFAKRIKKLSDAGIKVYMIIGNHDLHNSVFKATSVEIYDVLDMPGVYVRRRADIDVIDTSAGPFQVVALPYMSPSNLVEEGEGIGDTAQYIRNSIDTLIDMLVKRMDKTLPTIFMSHFSIIGAVPGSEKAIMLGREVTLPVSTFARPEFDYVAMGHIHKHQALYDHPAVVYSGSIDRVDFSEEKEQKGFVEVELFKGDTFWRFIPLDTRPFRTIYVDGSKDDPYDKAMEKIEHEDLEGAIVKLKVKLPSHKLSALKEPELYKELRRRAFYVAGIEKEITSDLSHLRHPGITERMDVREAVGEYISKKGEYEDIKEDLLKVNDELMQELKEGEAIL